MGQTELRLQELGYSLPRKDYRGRGLCATKRYQNLIFVSGCGPDLVGGRLFRGKIGAELTPEEGYQAARCCAINVLAALTDAIGTLDRVVQTVKVFGLVASTADFDKQPGVMNGFSDALVEVLGKRGMHARSAMGTNSLADNIPVEVECIFEVSGF